jgi:hypothetical protein
MMRTSWFLALPEPGGAVVPACVSADRTWSLATGRLAIDASPTLPRLP